VWRASNGKTTDEARRVDWGAPGQYVVSALIEGGTISASGTSAATAIAAGAAAALWSRMPSRSAREIADELVRRATRVAPTDAAALGDGLLSLRDEPSTNAVPTPSRRGPMPQTADAQTSSSDVDSAIDAVARLRANDPGAHVRVTIIDVVPNGANGAAAPMPATTGLSVEGAAELQVRWNMSGHSVIAMLAEHILETSQPDAHAKLQDLMDSAQLPADDGSGVGSLAAWPDRIKAPPRGTPKEISELGQSHKPDHYINLPYTPPQKAITKLPAPLGEGANVLTALPEWLTQMTEGSTAMERVEALAYVLHLVGDLHQPLHCAVLVNAQFPQGDEGGNSIWFGKSEELHALWDGAIVTSAGNIPKAFAKLQGELGDAPDAATLKSGDLEAWAMETYEHARDAYDDFLADCPYQGEASRIDRHGRQVSGQQYGTPSRDYRTKARQVAEQCGILAAYRLADLIATTLSGGAKRAARAAPAKRTAKRSKR
jgi:hypothetical protein